MIRLIVWMLTHEEEMVDERGRSVQGLLVAPLISVRLTPEHSAPQ